MGDLSNRQSKTGRNCLAHANGSDTDKKKQGRAKRSSLLEFN